jgi:predicted TIM-barrel fold metal-dependent hydrolase
MRTDVSAFLGAYPFRKVPGTSPEAVLAAMDRTGIDQAWASHLPGIFWRDPAAGNAWLYQTCRQHTRLLPVPAVHPGHAHWEEVVREARDAGAPAVRADPTFYGILAAGPEMRALASACGAAGIPLALAVRLEDGRQRHPNDGAAELPAAAVRALVRANSSVRLLVTHADRAFVEEVHFGSTPAEAARIWWDITWIWGPPEDHLQILLQTIGPERFVLGSGQPLRIPENAVAKLDLLDLSPVARRAIESENADRIRTRSA